MGIDRILRRMSVAISELDLGIPEGLFRTSPLRAINQALSEVGGPRVSDMKNEAELRRAMRRLEDEV